MAERKTTRVAEWCAILAFLCGVPALWVSNEPVMARWLKELNRNVTSLAAGTSSRALLAAGVIFLLAAVIEGYALLFLLHTRSFGQAVLVVGVVIPLAVALFAPWAYWNARVYHPMLVIGPVVVGAVWLRFAVWGADAGIAVAENRRHRAELKAQAPSDSLG